MKRFLIVICLLFFTAGAFAQQFSQYNTGTLFDSFENPSSRSFIPDSSRQLASNFLVPNVDANFSLSGDAQQTLKNRAFSNEYNNKLLQVDDGGKFNYIRTNLNAYVLMVKLFTSLNGYSEIGLSAQVRSDGRGAITDGYVGLFNGAGAFKNDSYDNVLNSKYSFELYNQVSFTYREELSKQFAFGLKLSYLYGIDYQNVNITQSHITFDKQADTASLSLSGTNQKTNLTNGNFFFNPGASISIGSTYTTQDGFIIQGNIKDFGFIHWQRYMQAYDFNDTQSIYDLTSAQREGNVYDGIEHVITGSGAVGGTTTKPVDGHAELSASKVFWLDDDYTIKYSPTFIASKELFYNGFTGALVNPVQYGNDVVTLTAAYDDMRILDIGGQFMIKSPNAEFFIGSDRLAQTGSLTLAALRSGSAINSTGSFTGADIFIGFSMKFGAVIEHPMNASYIPMGTKGFLGRLWDHIFASSNNHDN